MNLTDHRIEKIIDENGGNFTVREFGESRARLNPEAIKDLVQFRAWHGYSTLLTPEGKWREQGAHSIGAFDQVLYKQWKQEQPDPMEIWRIATTWPWWGVGIYFDVSAFGEPAIMIHTDICRPDQRNRPQRWIRARKKYYYQSVINGKFYEKGTGAETTLKEEIAIWKRTSTDLSKGNDNVGI